MPVQVLLHEGLPLVDDLKVSDLIAEGIHLVQEHAGLQEHPDPENLEIISGIGSLLLANAELQTNGIVRDPLKMLTKTPYPRTPIAEEAAVSIAVSPILTIPQKVGLLNVWATAASSGTKRANRLAPTKNLAMISAISVIDDRYGVAERDWLHDKDHVNEIDALVTLLDLERPIVGKLLRLRDRQLLKRGIRALSA